MVKRVIVQRVLPDGGCLFRAIATALLKVELGIRVGLGKKVGHEKIVGDAVQNAVSAWIRTLTMHRLAGGNVDRDTKWGKYSLEDVLQRVRQLFVQREVKPTRPFKTKADAQEFVRILSPDPPPLHAGEGDHKIGNISAATLTLSGRKPKESFAEYCTRLLRPQTWGGESECFVASHVLRRPIKIYQTHGKPLKYDGGISDQDGPKEEVHILYSPHARHYDAIV